MKTLRNMLTRGASLGIATVTLLGASAAFGETNIVSNVAPPPARAERAPPPRDGYIWGAGHWEWRGQSYTWVSGTWIAERRGAHWTPDRWEQQGEQWHFLPGHWER